MTSTGSVTGYRRDDRPYGLIPPQFAPTKGVWPYAKLAFPKFAGSRGSRMISTDRVAQILRNAATIAALLVWADGSHGAALAQSSRSGSKALNSASKTLNTTRPHDQELDSIQAEQRKSSETEQRLSIENSAIADERRRLNQSLIASASRIRATEERIAVMEVRLREFDSTEANIRRSLEGRRTQIAEVLAALQRIGKRPPPAIFVGARDAVESLRIAMALEAVLPQMRSEANRLQVELTDLARVKAAKAAEHSQLAAELADLAIMQKNMAALIDSRQARQSEVEQAISAERQRAATLSRQVDNLKDLIGKLEPASDGTKRTARAQARSGEESKTPN